MIEVPENHLLELRNALHAITSVDRVPLAEQPSRIAALLAESPHGIRLLESAQPVPNGEHPRTCHAYTFDLMEVTLRRNSDGDFIVPSAEFVAHMIDGGTERDTPTEGDVLVYYDQGEIQHSGRWRAGRVHSKWGIGHIWSHDVFETPATYGCRVRVFRSQEPPEHLAEWERYTAPFLPR